MPLLLIIFYATAITQAVVINLLVYGYAGDFYQRSNFLLLSLKQNMGNVEHRLISRKQVKYRQTFLNSCQVEKIKFGLSNFIEKSTPPMFQLFCVERIVDFLLVKLK